MDLLNKLKNHPLRLLIKLSREITLKCTRQPQDVLNEGKSARSVTMGVGERGNFYVCGVSDSEVVKFLGGTNDVLVGSLAFAKKGIFFFYY